MNSSTYVGTVDATPLYVIVLAEARRWGLAPREVDELMLHLRAALEWIRGPGDLDGDSYLEYPARTGRARRSQGWNDSFDAIQFADGRLAEGPIAVAEVEVYTYRALVDAAQLLDLAGDPIEPARTRREAEELATRFRRDFWMNACGFPPWPWTATSGRSTRWHPMPDICCGRGSSRRTKSRRWRAAWWPRSCSAGGARAPLPPPTAGTGPSPTAPGACGPGVALREIA